jgi:hypothetical protein
LGRLKIALATALEMKNEADQLPGARPSVTTLLGAALIDM